MWLLIGTRRYNKAHLEWIQVDEQDARYLQLRIAGEDFRIPFSTSSAATAALTEILGADTIVSLND
jgi:hypothetical protein